MMRLATIGGVLILGAAALAGVGSARANAVFAFGEDGGNVVGTLSGSLNLTGAVLSAGDIMSHSPRLSPVDGYINATPESEPANEYFAVGLDPDESFGSGGSVSGVATGLGPFEVSTNGIVLPVDYSGELLVNSLTIPHQTFDSMGIDIGPSGFSRYVFALEGTQQIVTVVFESIAAGAPEPPTWALMLSSLGFLALMTRWRRRRQSTVVAPT